MTLTHTFTQTYTITTPANPYLACSECGAHVCHWPDIDGPLRNEPCGHTAGYDDLCPSWGPVNGCQCRQHLGHVPHGLAPDCSEHGPK